MVMGVNTDVLALNRVTSGYDTYEDLASVSQTWKADHWYRMEVTWEVGGNITGRLYDSDGTTLLNTVTGHDNTFTSGGIAFRAFGDTVHFDTVEAARDAAPLTSVMDLNVTTLAAAAATIGQAPSGIPLSGRGMSDNARLSLYSQVHGGPIALVSGESPYERAVDQLMAVLVRPANQNEEGPQSELESVLNDINDAILEDLVSPLIQ
jgi:hypothetical protein